MKTKESKLVLKEKSKSAAKIIAYVRDTYFKTKLTNAAANSKEIFGIVKYLLGKDAKPSYPTTNNNENLVENFAQFFKSNTQKLYQQLFENTKSKCTDSNNSVSPTIKMTNFEPVSEKSVKAIILNMHNKTCSLDVIPAWLLRR